MIFADKIIQLRKKNGWSQEELAEKMNVSRQAVSKWESAQAVPELQKIIALADLFCVTTDYLLRDEIETEQFTAYEPSERKKVSLAMAHEYVALRKRAALMIALATLLCIISVIPLIALTSLSELEILGISEQIACIVGLCALFVLVAIAVAIFIICGFQSSPYEFLNEKSFDTEYGVTGIIKEKEKAFRPTYIRFNLVGILTCILAPLPLIISGIGGNDLATVLMLCLMFLIVSVGVFCLVYVGVRWASLRRLQKDPEYLENSEKNKRSPLLDLIDTVYWLLITAAYFLWSFLGNAWHISWLLWVIGGIIFSAIEVVFKYLENKNSEKK